LISQSSSGGRITLLSLLALASLLVLPGIALQKSGTNWRWVAPYALAINALTYGCYAIDKRRAQENQWRVPEARLHLLSWLGGWPGAFVAQRWLRHKSAKGSFLFVFWLTVLVYQVVALDSLQNWRLTHLIIRWTS
jgi:uncharacterized membrane protein YsdA (DUF1294 family)